MSSRMRDDSSRSGGGDRKRRGSPPTHSNGRDTPDKRRRDPDGGGRDRQRHDREEDDRHDGGRRFSSRGPTKVEPSSRAASIAPADVKPPLSKEHIQEELKTKEILYQANMEIQERMRQMNVPNQSTMASASLVKRSAVLRPEEASAFIDYQMEKVNRLNELKSRLSARASALPSSTASTLRNMSVLKAPGVVLERVLAGAAAISTSSLSSTNTSIGENKPPLPLGKGQLSSSSAAPSASGSGAAPHQRQAEIDYHLDPRIQVKASTRQRRQTFEFKQKGEFEKLANVQRAKAKLEQLQGEISRAAKHTGISSAVKLAIVTPSSTADSSETYIPSVEWWDEIVLGSGKGYNTIPSLDINPQERYAEVITALVEHPIQLKPPDEPLQPTYIRAKLTKKEGKKLRRQNRRELLKEKSEKIRLGLEKAPEPKLKISNLMRVLGTDAIQDPTKMEAKVRKQIADRVQKHLTENETRKLTKEERGEKAARKIAEDTSLAVHVAIYKIKSLANQSKRFKVLMNAKQLQMTGMVLLLEDINVVVVEGGPKQQKFYKNLMLNRIKWAEEIAGQKKEIIRTATANEEGATGGERNECTLIWEGIVQKRAFGEPRFVPANNHKHARELLDKHGVPQYWDLCYSTSILLAPEEQ